LSVFVSPDVFLFDGFGINIVNSSFNGVDVFFGVFNSEVFSGFLLFGSLGGLFLFSFCLDSLGDFILSDGFLNSSVGVQGQQSFNVFQGVFLLDEMEDSGRSDGSQD
jgi:hypothetical protein